MWVSSRVYLKVKLRPSTCPVSSIGGLQAGEDVSLLSWVVGAKALLQLTVEVSQMRN